MNTGNGEGDGDADGKGETVTSGISVISSKYTSADAVGAWIAVDSAVNAGGWLKGVKVGKVVNCGGASPPNDERNSKLTEPKQYISKAIKVAPPMNTYQIFLSGGKFSNQSSISFRLHSYCVLVGAPVTGGGGVMVSNGSGAGMVIVSDGSTGAVVGDASTGDGMRVSVGTIGVSVGTVVGVALGIGVAVGGGRGVLVKVDVGGGGVFVDSAVDVAVMVGNEVRVAVAVADGSAVGEAVNVGVGVRVCGTVADEVAVASAVSVTVGVAVSVAISVTIGSIITVFGAGIGV